MKRVLIINSDSPNNMGDRAILLGNIRLLRKTFGDGLDIRAMSEHPKRDEDWYGIGFVPIAVQSLSLFDMVRLMRAASKVDAIFWGGGELLKDYTNKLALVYWVVKMSLVSIVNPKIYGMFQGIGPTQSKLGKWLICRIVQRCAVFFTRDDESKQKLLSWGVKSKVVSSFDPAILEKAGTPSESTKKALLDDFGIDETVLSNFVGVGPRNWFHYDRSGWLPYKYRKYLRFGTVPEASHEQEAMLKNMALLLDETVDALDTNMIFFPMHMSEDDAVVSRKIIKLMRNKSRTSVLDKDTISPQDYLNVIGRSRSFIGIRLHSTILSTIANVPSFVFYYVDKGRLYFEQLGLEKYSAPIESILNEEMVPDFVGKLLELERDGPELMAVVGKRLEKMKGQIVIDFQKEFISIEKT